MSGYRRLFRALFSGPRDVARETDEELQAHLEMRMADLMARGMSEDEARAEAHRRFGDLERARKELRSAGSSRDRAIARRERLDDVRRDLVVTWRRARRNPLHAGMSIAIFALGIGLTTVMFTVLDQVLIRPLPFPDSDRLVALRSVQEGGGSFSQVSMGNWFDWRAENSSLTSTALYGFPFDVTVSTDSDVFTAPTVAVAGAFFETLRPPMIVGRAFTEEEAESEIRVVVVSEGFWRRVLGSDSILADRIVTLDAMEWQVVGVVSTLGQLPQNAEIWRPRATRPFVGSARNNINYMAVGRLADGVSVEQAGSDLTAVALGIRDRDPAGIYSHGVDVRSLHQELTGDSSTSLKLLMGAVLLVLLIACANLAALGFAQAAERSGEVALKLSLGAERGRLLQQLLTEQLALALAGGLLGIGLAVIGTDLMLDRLSSFLPRVEEIGFDSRIALFGILIALIAGVASGLGPARRAARGEATMSQMGGRSVKGGLGVPGLTLVVVEVALTTALLIGGGLLVRSLSAVSSRDLGFDADGVVAAQVSLSSAQYGESEDNVISYWGRFVDHMRAMPGVESVGLGTWIPTGGGGRGFIELPDDPEPDGGAGYRVVSDDYFDALRIPLNTGRAFDERDQFGTERVVLINQAMADKFWPDIDPVGHRVKAVSMESFYNGGSAPWLTIIGVVGDVRHHGLEDDGTEEMFVLHRQMPWMARSMTAVIRMRPGAAASSMLAVRSHAQDVDPALAVDVSLLSTRVRELLAERRLITTVLATFAALALVLASLGVYGVISFTVSRRAQEMAIRAALGATGTSLVRLVVLGATKLAALGTAIGLISAFWGRGVLDSILLDVPSTDPAPYVVAILVLLVVSVSAALIPGMRAARTDPLEGLRDA